MVAGTLQVDVFAANFDLYPVIAFIRHNAQRGQVGSFKHLHLAARKNRLSLLERFGIDRLAQPFFA